MIFTSIERFSSKYCFAEFIYKTWSPQIKTVLGLLQPIKVKIKIDKKIFSLSPICSGNLYKQFIFWIACPEAPFTKLSIAEKIINLFLILVSQTDISQLFVFKTFLSQEEYLLS